jgi:TetR/AcrR family transcriptional regulator, repressor for uid operon
MHIASNRATTVKPEVKKTRTPARSKENTRERILSTARELYSRPGNTLPTMDDVANAVGIGRATLYRHFDNRDELLLTVIEQEALEIASRVEKRIRKIEKPADYVVEGTLQAMLEIQKSPLPHSLFQTGSSNGVNRLLFDSDRLINIGLSIMTPVVTHASESGKLRSSMAPELMVEWILRILISLVSVPSPQLKTRSAIRDFLRAIMLPVLEG